VSARTICGPFGAHPGELQDAKLPRGYRKKQSHPEEAKVAKKNFKKEIFCLFIDILSIVL
jgi:hypothetical protein